MTMKAKEIRWRLRVMMAERNIKTVTDLGRRLNGIGLEISSQQLSRVVNDMPQRINTDLLAGLLTVLDCTPTDLFQVKERDAHSVGIGREVGKEKKASSMQGAPTQQRRQSRRVLVPAEMDDDITGPAVSPFPLNGRT